MNRRITVRVKPGARRTQVTQLSADEFVIAVTERPEKGKATAAVRRALAQALRVAPSRLSLVMGITSKTKVFEVL